MYFRNGRLVIRTRFRVPKTDLHLSSICILLLGIKIYARIWSKITQICDPIRPS